MTMTQNSLLVELLVEELPPKSLKMLGQSFAATLTASLHSQRLVESDKPVYTSFATPRRLAVVVENVLSQASGQTLEIKLMPVRVGLDGQGSPTPALQKKIQSLGIRINPDTLPDSLLRRMDGKTETLFVRTETAGTKLAAGLQKALDDTLHQLPVAKVMTYQLADGWHSIDFVRPAHGLTALHGDTVVPVSILGLDAGRETQGHRFEARTQPLVIHNASSYAQQLQSEGAVIAGFDTRRQEIATQLAAAAAKANLTPIEDGMLLDEVTALVEYPTVLIGRFDPAFLEVPQECLILTMKANQRYFPLLDANGRLASQFLIVSNIRPADPGLVISGNERVLQARLADAQFFFNQDRKKPLSSYLPALEQVVYHNKLGTQAERITRITEIAEELGGKLGEILGEASLQEKARQAARLCKADLLTGMVGEFPELQGIMGRYYALHDDISADVADAIEDHYKPRFAGDNLPRNLTGTCVALADKLETLAGMFGIDEIPTGSKDPFALRRHTLGIIRMLVEQKLEITVNELLDESVRVFREQTKNPDFLTDQSPVKGFIRERARGYFESRGYALEAIDAAYVKSGTESPLYQLEPIVQAATEFLATEQGQYLAEANKRIVNILNKSDNTDLFLLEYPEARLYPDLFNIKPKIELFQPQEEKDLYNALETHGNRSLERHNKKDYAGALTALMPLCEPIRAFFEKVMVNVEDSDVRKNRITLLRRARFYMNRFAELSLMAKASS